MRGYPCRDIIRNPDACAPCPKNPINHKVEKQDFDPFVTYLFWLDSRQAAGATFMYQDLTDHEWDALIVLKSERAKYEQEKIK
jgi:hypothetical protein